MRTVHRNKPVKISKISYLPIPLFLKTIRSAEYEYLSKTCNLLRENSLTKPNNLMVHNTMTFYEKICGSGAKYCFQKTDNQQLNHLIKFYEGVSVESCMQMCLTLNNNLCRLAFILIIILIQKCMVI